MEKKLFEEELAYWLANKKRLLETAPGKIVLIKGDKDYGFFDTDEAAYEAGVRLFGDESFFIQELLEYDNIADFPAYLVNCH